MLKYSMHRITNILLALLIIAAGVVGLAGCKKKTVIFPLLNLSPDGNKIAFWAGPDENPNTRNADIEEGIAYVLDLQDNEVRVIDIPQSDDVSAPNGWAWRPDVEPIQLFLTTYPIETEPMPIGLIGVAISEQPSIVFSRELTKNWLTRVLCLSWSPNGKILAVGQWLGLSLLYDDGKTLINTEIPVSSSTCTWTDDHTLYILGKDEESLLEIEILNEQAQVKRTIAAGVSRVCGSLNGKVVYYSHPESKIYCGDQLLYKSDQKIGCVYADGSYVALQGPPSFESSRILVLNEKGDVISEKNIVGEVVLRGLSSKQNCVYLVKDLQAIQRYSFVGDDEIHTIFHVSELE
ncbi:MAG: hypothetical protein ACYS9Y_01605 [Planctomycetota bacterium]